MFEVGRVWGSSWVARAGFLLWVGDMRAGRGKGKIRNDELTCGVVGCGDVPEQRVGGVFASCLGGFQGDSTRRNRVSSSSLRKRGLNGISAFAVATMGQGLGRRMRYGIVISYRGRSGGTVKRTASFGEMLLGPELFASREPFFIRGLHLIVVRYVGKSSN